VAGLKLFRTLTGLYLYFDGANFAPTLLVSFPLQPLGTFLISIIIFLPLLNPPVPINQDDRKIEPDNLTEKCIFK
jgi:hypothetical protein